MSLTDFGRPWQEAPVETNPRAVSVTAASPTTATGTASAAPRSLIPRNKRQEEIEDLIHRVQDDITRTLSEIDGTPFREDAWQRPEGGGGRSRVLQDGKVFEKAGVNVSVVHGLMPAAAARQMNSRGKDIRSSDPIPFYAAGISLVLHPRNPMAPTVHANFRYFEVRDYDAVEGTHRTHWWYGGGADLTPAYVFEEDAVHFHQVFKDACDRHGDGLYGEFKRWCDEYFCNTHRGERRGIGGIFFDDFGETVMPVAEADKLRDVGGGAAFAFVKDCADSFLQAYVPILLRRKDLPFTPEQKEWQQVREFESSHQRCVVIASNGLC